MHFEGHRFNPRLASTSSYYESNDFFTLLMRFVCGALHDIHNITQLLGYVLRDQILGEHNFACPSQKFLQTYVIKSRVGMSKAEQIVSLRMKNRGNKYINDKTKSGGEITRN